MNSKKNFADLNGSKLVNKINDLVIGEDSTDLFVVNSDTKFTDNIEVSNSITTKNSVVSENIKGTDISYGSVWTQLGQDIDGEATNDSFGYSVSLSSDGTIVAIGGWENDNTNGIDSGHVRVYKYDGSYWNQLGGDIDGETAYDYSGWGEVSLSSDGSIVAIGATNNDDGGTDSGHVRVYKYNGSAWSKLGDDIDGEATYNYSGYSVSLSSDGTIVAIGATYNDDGGGTNSGHVRVYQYNGSAWSKLGDDIDGEAANDYSGRSVSLSSDGTIVAIGATNNDDGGTDSGHVRVYQYNGSAWSKLGDDIDGEAANDYSGYSVSLSSDGTIVAIGATNNDDGGTDSGHVRVYEYNGSSWIQLGSDIDGEAANDYSGRSVSLSSDGTIVSISANKNDGINGTDSGHVRVYQYDGNSWVQLGLDIDGEAADDAARNVYSQCSVSLSSDGTSIAIGASDNDGINGIDSGHVRVYKIDKVTNLNVDGNLVVSGNLSLTSDLTTNPSEKLEVNGNVKINNNLNVLGDLDIQGQGKIKGDVVIGDDSNDYLTVNSETRFHSDVNVGGSSIRLHSSDDTNSNNFISILDQNIHSVHAKTLREIQDLKIGDNNGKYLKFDDTLGLVASTVSGGGGSGIVNNRIDGDLTIGEDDSEMLTIASKLHIPGGKSGQVLTKGTDGSIEYGPTAFDSVTLPNDKQIQHKTLTGENTLSVPNGGSVALNDGTGNLAVTLTPSIVSAQVMVSVNAKVYSSGQPFLTLQKQVGTAAATIVGEAQEFDNFKFIDTLTDQTAVTYTALVNNPQNQMDSVLLNSTPESRLDSTLFDDSNFKFMWQAGKTTTLKNQYTVTEHGNTITVSQDANGYKYVSPADGNYYTITNTIVSSSDRTLTLAFAVDFTHTDPTEKRQVFYQGPANDSGWARNHEVFLNTNGQLSYDNYEPGGNRWYDSTQIISGGLTVIVMVITLTQITTYENGVSKGASNKPTGNNYDLYNGTQPIKMVIGGSAHDSRVWGNDKLYSVAVWDRDLTASEAQSITFDMLANKASGASSIITAEQISSARTFTTANPLLANPSTADAGKIVTVNGTGDALEYGGVLQEKNFEYKMLTGRRQIQLPARGSGALTVGSNGAAIFNDGNEDLEITITPSTASSKILLSVNLFGEAEHPKGVFMTLQKSVAGSSTLITPSSTDSTLGLISMRHFYNGSSEYASTAEAGCFRYVDVLSSQQSVTYTVVLCNENSETNIFWTNGALQSSPGLDNGISVITAEEVGGNAITSFTQEQALAGAGGTLFQSVTSSTIWSQQNYPLIPSVYNNKIDNNVSSGEWTLLNFTGVDPSVSNPFIAYEFAVPQIVTSYRLWPTGRSSGAMYEPTGWELRASTDSTTYNSNYTVLDSQSDQEFNRWSESGTLIASDRLGNGKLYHINTVGAFKYFVLHFTAGSRDDFIGVGEWALYGGGFTIPSQVGHSGKILKTNGTSLKWEAPVDALLPAPVPENKGKIVTVNAAGDDLEYGANFRELACKQTLITTGIEINDSTLVDDVWVDLASHLSTDNISTEMNTETLVNVPKDAKLEIQAQITFGHADNTAELHFGIRLGKKVNGNIIWGHTSGVISITDSTNNALSDPKGAALGNRTRAWKSEYSKYGGNAAQYFTTTINASYIDEDPTNGLSGYHDVTYFLRVTNLYPDSASLPFTIGYNQRPSSTQNRTTSPTIIIVKEIGSGAITSFTQEQALAGAGGTAAFTAYGIKNTTYLTSSDYHTGHVISNLYDNYLRRAGTLVAISSSDTVSFAYDFSTPQIVTKYRMWPRATSDDNDVQAPSSWELRAATTKTLYDAGTYTILDSHTGLGELDWDQTIVYNGSATELNSDNLSKANGYNLSTIGAYKYYVLHITSVVNISAGSGLGGLLSLGEFALYGGGFTIPSQVGNAGKQLITNGTSLTWGSPSSILVPSPTGNANKALTVNSAGTGLEYSNPKISGSIVQTQHLNYVGEIYESSTSTTFTDFDNTNFVVSINPTSTNSRLLFNCNIHVGIDSGTDSRWYGIRLYRKIGSGNWTWLQGASGDNGNPGGNLIPVFITGGGGKSGYQHDIDNLCGSYLDTPDSSLNTHYYTLYWDGRTGDGNSSRIHLNTPHTDTSAFESRPISTLTIQEIYYP